MNLAVSNLAWDNENSQIIFNTLKENDITQIECILSKIKNWDDLANEDIVNFKNELTSQGIVPYSIQSLFYGIDCENIGNVECIISHFKRLIEYSKILDVKILVFGSPNLRKKVINWEKCVIDIFKSIDYLLNETGIIVVIEPNSKVYGGQFFHSISEISKFIQENRFKNIRTMIDTHNSLLENLNFIEEFKEYFEIIEHIHISEPKLKHIIDSPILNSFSDNLKMMNYKKTITYEVLKSEHVLDSIKTFSKIFK